MIVKSSFEHDSEFKHWAGFDSIADLTCRPISDEGQRVVPDGKVNRLSYINEDLKLVGKFSWFDYNSRNRSAEFGYMINPSLRKKGYARKMLIEAFNNVFSNTNLNKLYCQTAEFNEASVKLLKSLKMNLDGRLRQHHEKDGKLYDDLVFSILRQEWETLSHLR